MNRSKSNNRRISLLLMLVTTLSLFILSNSGYSQIDITKTDVTCAGASDGTATVTGVQNGTPPFTYSWSNGGTGASISGLPEGTYSVTVTDDHGCSGSESVVIELSATALDVDINIVDESCVGTGDGMVIAWVNTGTGPYNYQWSNGGTGSSITGLSAGTYSVVVTDANGCQGSGSGTVSVSLNQYPVSITAKHDVSCYGGSDGFATATPGGGDPPYSFQWSNGSSGATASGLSAGTYTVIVTDVNGCRGNTAVSISEPAPLSISISGGNTTVSYCQGSSPPSMTLSASASGGTPPYSFSWPGGSITVSSSGTYSCTVTDANGCTDNASVYVLFIEVDCSIDPNEIVGPGGYGENRWVSVNDHLGYTVRFENDPEFATAPAQEVVITVPIDPSVNMYSMRLGDFGFGDFVFPLGTGISYYDERHDIIDSLNIYVDVIAGLDVNTRLAFWIFKSIDPATGLPPNDPDVGFLLVNDSITHRGEGFVSLRMEPDLTAVTGDSILVAAEIVFDINDPIETNTWENTIDAFPPSSTVDSIAPVIDTVSFQLTFSGQDDTGGCGINSFLLYFSKDNGPFYLYGEYPEGSPANFTGLENSSYQFFSLAKDNVGNIEPMKNTADVTTVITGGQIAVGVKVFLEGPFGGTEMATALNTYSFLPLQHPYNTYPWYYVGTETVTTIPNTEVVDWVLMELRETEGDASTATSSTIIAQKACMLLSSGDVVDLDGISRLVFNGLNIENNLFVIIWHRNHLGVMSGMPLQLVEGAYQYDFSGGSNQVYGGVLAHKELAAGIWGMIGSDGNADGVISNQDKIDIWSAQAGFSGYNMGDFDMDSQVSNPDKLDMWLPNSGHGTQVPDNLPTGSSPQGFKCMVPE